MQLAILGDGGLGRAVHDAASTGGHGVRIFGRPSSGRHLPGLLRGADVVIEASRPDQVVPNVMAALDGGCRRLVIATTGWATDRREVDDLLRERDAVAVVASNFSLGVALFGRLVDAAVDLYGALPEFDPFLLEWHRRAKADRPSGTAADLARRIAERHPTKHRVAQAQTAPPAPDELEVVSLRAGASPGMHRRRIRLRRRDPVELRLTARDRSAYAVGILAAAAWLHRFSRGGRESRPVRSGIDELLAAAPFAPVAA